MWGKRGCLAVLVAIGAAAAFAGTASADATYSASTTMPVATTVTNPCTGEPVALSGTYHVESNYSVTTDSSGIRFHDQKTTKLSLSGLATPSGARYQNEQQQTTEDNFTLTVDLTLAPAETTDEATMLLIRQAEVTHDDDFYVKFVSHLTFNANAVVTANLARLDVVCR